MGEIGIDRRTFYEDLRWWEVKAIIRGYNARHHAGWEQARLVAYNAHYCMGSKDPIPLLSDWIKFSWEKSDASEDLTDGDIARLQEEMRSFNAKSEEERENILKRGAAE